MLYKICNKQNCNELTPQPEIYCSKHKLITKERHKAYDKSLRDKKSKAFYNSIEWRAVQAQALRKHNHMDLYDYYINNRLSAATTAHHITELKDDWSKRLDIDNLFPCTVSTHSIIHKLYSKDKAGTQKLLRELIERYKREFM